MECAARGTMNSWLDLSTGIFWCYTETIIFLGLKVCHAYLSSRKSFLWAKTITKKRKRPAKWCSISMSASLQRGNKCLHTQSGVYSRKLSWCHITACDSSNKENSNSTEYITHLTGSSAPLHSRRWKAAWVQMWLLENKALINEAETLNFSRL